MTETKQLFALYTSFSVVFFLVPISIYGVLNLWQKRAEMFIIKRNPIIIWGLNIIFIMIMIFCGFLQLLYAFNINNDNNNNKLIIYSSNFIYVLSIWLLLYYFNVRSWITLMNYYKTDNTHKSWRSIIDPRGSFRLNSHLN